MKYWRIRAVGRRPESESLIGMHAASKAVAGAESLIDKRAFGVVRIEGVIKEREFGERADAQSAAISFDQQLEPHPAFFAQRPRAVQTIDALPCRFQLIGDRVGFDLTELRRRRTDVFDALSGVRRIRVMSRVRHL